MNIKIGQMTIDAQLATTKEELILGLSGRKGLTSNEGLFFIFPSPGWKIWMKDMNLPIDVIWISEDLKIVYIVENMTPESYPKTYVSPTPTKYVLEIAQGSVQQYEIKIGQNIESEDLKLIIKKEKI